MFLTSTLIPLNGAHVLASLSYSLTDDPSMSSLTSTSISTLPFSTILCPASITVTPALMNAFHEHVYYISCPLIIVQISNVVLRDERAFFVGKKDGVVHG